MPPDDGAPRQQYSFTDFTRSRPRDPIPGDRLDDEFQAQRTAIAQVRAEVGALLRTDGRLHNGAVGWASFDEPLKARLASGVSDVRRVLEGFTREGWAASNSAVAQAEAASRSATAASISASASESAHAGAEARAKQLKAEMALMETRIEARWADVENDANDAQYWGNYAYDWGQVSWRWAEWMDGPIPSDILATMGITGSHWSSAWWADQANQIVSGFSADNIPYDNTNSGLTATDTQAAIDEIAAEKLDDAPSDGTLYGRKSDAWTPVPAGLPEAPTDGQSYARRGSDHTWQVATSGGGGGADAMMRGVATYVSTDTACVKSTRYRATSNVTLTLPTMAAADALVIERDTTLGNVTIGRNGQSIDGVASDFTLDIDKQSLLLTCTGTNQVVTRLIGALPAQASLGNTELLMHMEGANGGAVFADSSNYARAVTLVGSPTTTTAQAKIGTTGAFFAAGAANTWIDLGTQITLGQTFTIEFWLWFTGVAASSYFSTGATVSGNSIWAYEAISNQFHIGFGNGSAINWTFGTTTWHYVSLQRDASNVWSLYKDGALVSPQVTLGGVIDCSALRFGGGVTPGTSGKCIGGMDEVRISNIARYSGTYTPPTVPWTVD